MTGLVAAVIAVVGSTLGGRSLLALFDRVCGTREIQRPSAEIWGASILLGAGFTSALAFVWSDIGQPLTAQFSWGQVGLSGVLGMLVIVNARRQLSKAHDEDSRPALAPLARACQVVLGFVIAAAFLQTFLTPQKFWDERAIFAIKAKVLYEAGTIDAPELLHPDFVQYHPRYPLMLPLLERHVYALAGRANDRWAKVWFPLMYAGLVLSYAGVLARRTSPDWGWLMATVLGLVPVLLPDEYGFLSAQADAPMACFQGVAVLYFWDALHEHRGAIQRRSLLLASSLAAGACFVKDEGLAYLLVNFLAWASALLLGGGRLGFEALDEKLPRRLGHQLAAMTTFGLFAAILLIPWMRHRATLPTTTEMHYLERMEAGRLLERLSTLQWSLPHLVRRMFVEWRIWGLPWWLLLLAALTAPRRSWAGPQRFLLLILLGALAAFVVAGMLAPAELEEHLGGSSHRYLMQLVPVAVLFVAAVWSPAVSVPPVAEPPKRTA